MNKKRRATKKNDKKKEKKMRYGIHITPTSDDAQESRFALAKHEYSEKYNSNSILFLPKKIDSLINKIEKLGVRAIDIEISSSKYSIRFIEDEKGSDGADLLYDVYVNNPSYHVFFIWSEKYSEHPKSFELIINIAGPILEDINESLIKFTHLSNVIDTNSELKTCSKYIDIVLDAIKKGKKRKLKKLYQIKK